MSLLPVIFDKEILLLHMYCPLNVGTRTGVKSINCAAPCLFCRSFLYHVCTEKKLVQVIQVFFCVSAESLYKLHTFFCVYSYDLFSGQEKTTGKKCFGILNFTFLGPNLSSLGSNLLKWLFKVLSNKRRQFKVS